MISPHFRRVALARLGYEVVGVDISRVDIHQMIEIAKKEDLNLKGIVANMYEFKITEYYDIVLLDSMFHFYKNDKEKEIDFLKRLMKEIKSNGILCILINKSKHTESVLEKVFKDSETNWKVIEDEYIDYPKMDAKYRMFIRKKLI